MRKKENRESFKQRLIGKMSPSTLKLIMQAYNFARYGHKEQKRDDGKRFFEHPRRVALILIDELGIYDHEMIIAAFLHDIKEDTWLFTWNAIKRHFGKRVSRLVKLVTKKPGQNTEKYYLKLQKSERWAQILKVTDRIDNIRDLNGCTPEKIKKQVKETEKYFVDWSGILDPKLKILLLNALDLAKNKTT